MPVDAEGAYHEPVLKAEVIRFLSPAAGMVIVDGTLGGGGHSEALLEAGAHVIGLDEDPEAIAASTGRLRLFGAQFRAVCSNFSRAAEVLDDLGVGGIDGALLDLGVSTRQLDTPERGFSFMARGPLDMRMDPECRVTAADIVNTAELGELIRIFRDYGEEPLARRIAAYLIGVRSKKTIRTTTDLAHAIEAVAPRRGRIHPATRIFQALRIAVNRELDVLPEALEALSARLRSGARLAVISFHSLEDRIVKQFLKKRSTEWLDRPEWSEPRRNPNFLFHLVTPRPVRPSPEEQSRNPHSRSAKLRVAERIHVY